MHGSDDAKLTRGIPLTGTLSLVAAITLLFIYWKFQAVYSDWSSNQVFFYMAVCGLLVYYGLSQIIPSLIPAARRQKHSIHRYRVLLPRSGAVYLALMSVMLIGAILGHSNMLLLIFSMMAGPFVLNGWVTFTMLGRNSLVRRLPKRAMAGEAVTAEIEFFNGKYVFASWVMAVRDQISNGRERLQPTVLFARVGPRKRSTGYYQMKLMQRGTYSFGPLEMATRFPLGVVERGLIVDNAGSLLVYPRIGRLSRDWRRRLFPLSEAEVRSAGRPGIFDDEFHGIREFRQGDSPRSIHWRTSARRSELMVREYHQNRAQSLGILVDLWQPKQPTTADYDRVELALSFAATLWAEQCQHGSSGTAFLGIAGEEFKQFQGRGGQGLLELGLDGLSLANASVFPRLNDLMEAFQTARTSKMSVVLITSRKRPDAADQSPDETWQQLRPHLHPEFEVRTGAVEDLESIFTVDWLTN